MSDEPGVIVYTAPNCGYCTAAKNLLRNKGVQFQEINVGHDPVLRQELVTRSGGRRTVPQVFIANQSLGGYDDIAALNASGELDRLLQAHNLTTKRDDS
jgi:glutaredoxin 3